MPPVEKLVTTAVEIWLWLSLASTSTASLKPREHLYQLSFSFLRPCCPGGYSNVTAFQFTVAMDVLIWLYTLAALLAPMGLGSQPSGSLDIEAFVKNGNRVAFGAAYTGGTRRALHPARGLNPPQRTYCCAGTGQGVPARQ